MTPRLVADVARADILGVFDLSKPFAGPRGMQIAYQYLRPVVELPTADAWGSEASIRNGAWLFLRPEIVCHPDLVKPYIERTLNRLHCGRARVLLRIALEELIEHPEALTPLGQQIVAGFAANPDIPDYWRF